MHGASSTKCNQSKLTGIIAAFYRDHTQSLLHISVHHPYHAGSKSFDSNTASPLVKPSLDKTARAWEFNVKVTTEKLVCRKAAEQEIGIRYCGQVAFAIADGAGISAGGFWPDT